ncbi:MAG: SGNH/GDSL hydrolase family protein [Pseudomonadota bacterium]|nr:SGNH/GDSL hydrolase family protein [Pseudomonadota bacterium]
MKTKLRLTALALGAGALLAACGGSSNSGDTKVTAARVYAMGDSLVDSGSFGFKFTTQASDAAGKPIPTGAGSTPLWVDYVAANATHNAQPQLCAAASIGAAGAATANAGCTNFAVGGALVGPAGGATSVIQQMQNAAQAVAAQGGYQPNDLVLVAGGTNDIVHLLMGLSKVSDASAPVEPQLGAILTATDLDGARNAAVAVAGGLLASAAATDELVPYIDSVLGEGASKAGLPAIDRDAITRDLTAIIQATDLPTMQGLTRTFAAGLSPTLKQTQAALPQLAAKFSQQLAAQLANGVKTQLVEHGAQRVAVLNLPAVMSTPRLKALLATQNATQAAQTTQVLTAVLTAFNESLRQSLAAIPQALHIDFYSEFEKQIADPQSFGLSNVTTPVCPIVNNADGSENYAATFGGCTLAAAAKAHGLTEAKLRNTFYPANSYDPAGAYYTFANDSYPTAVAHQRLGQLAARELAKRGWL